MKHLIVLLVIQMMITNSFAAVGDTCGVGNDCPDTTAEQCDTDKCICNTKYINKGDGTCVSSACTTASACTTNAILNSYCGTSSVCVCDALSVTSSATTGTEIGACVAKTCTSGGTECNAIANAECSATTESGTCICSSGYTLTDGVCALPASSAGMIAASVGALLFALLLQVSLL